MVIEKQPRENGPHPVRVVQPSFALIEWMGSVQDENDEDAHMRATYVEAVSLVLAGSLAHVDPFHSMRPLGASFRVYASDLQNDEANIARGAKSAAGGWLARGYQIKVFAEKIITEGLNAPLRHHRDLFTSLFAEYQVNRILSGETSPRFSPAFIVNGRPDAIDVTNIGTDIAEVIEKAVPGNKSLVASLLLQQEHPTFLCYVDSPTTVNSA